MRRPRRGYTWGWVVESRPGGLITDHDSTSDARVGGATTAPPAGVTSKPVTGPTAPVASGTTSFTSGETLAATGLTARPWSVVTSFTSGTTAPDTGFFGLGEGPLGEDYLGGTT